MIKIIEHLVNILVKKQIVLESDNEIYAYGLTILTYKMIFILCAFLFCVFLNDFYVETLCFVTSFFAIRKYSGGFHAGKLYVCLLIFIVSDLLLIYFLYNHKISNEFIVLSLIVIIPTIYLKSPIDCEEKRLNENEKLKYKRSTLIRLITLLTIMFILFLAGDSKIVFSLYFACLTIYLLMLI